MKNLKKIIPLVALLVSSLLIFADEEEVIEGSKHIIALDLEARFELNGDGNEYSPRDSGSGSGFLFNYQYIFGLGIDINADQPAPLFLHYQKPAYLGMNVGINTDKFEGKSTRSGSPFRVDFASDVIDIEGYGQYYFKSGFGIDFSIRDSITEGARFQIFDDSNVGDTGLEKLDQNEFFFDIGINKYLVEDRLLIGLDLGLSLITADKPFFTGKKDDANDIDGSSFNFGFHLDYIPSSEKFKFGLRYNLLTLDQDTDVTLNVGGRVTTIPADTKYSVNRDEIGHFVELSAKWIKESNLAFNFTYSYTMVSDELDNELADAGIPTVTDRDISIHKFTFAPEYWVFNRMKILFKTGILMYDFEETGAESINVGGTIIAAPAREFDYLTWFAGISVDILF